MFWPVQECFLEKTHLSTAIFGRVLLGVPIDEISAPSVDNLIELAKLNIEVADTTMGKSVEEALQHINEHVSRQHPDYDLLGKQAIDNFMSLLEELKPSVDQSWVIIQH